MYELLARGGVLMIPIAACSIIGLAIVIERAIRFRAIATTPDTALAPILDDMEAGRAREAYKRAQDLPGPVPRVLAAGIRAYIRYRQEHIVEKSITRAGSRELALLENNLRGLNVIAGVAPLLGLLGTVIGMIRAFMQIQQHGGSVDAAHLAGGIWEAMLTTAAGLTVAIPCLLFYNYFMGRLNRVEADMKNAAVDLVEAIRERTDDGV